MTTKPRTQGSVPNVRRAITEGVAGRAAIRDKVAAMSRGTVGTQLKSDNRKRGLR